MKKLFKLCLLLMFILSLCYGNITFQSAFEALMIWFEKLVPSMFVAMVFVRLLYKQHVFQMIPCRLLEKLFHMDAKAFSLVLCTMFLGFPTGALFIDEAYAKKELDEIGAKRLIYTCSFATPGFVIMSCGFVLFGSLYIGFLLFFAQILSGLVLLFCTRKDYIAYYPTTQIASSFMKDMAASIIESGKALYFIGGYLLLFMSITSVLFSFFPTSISLILRILSEFSSGMITLSSLPYSKGTLLPLCCMLLSFGGLCVHMQIMSMVEHTTISYPTFLWHRCMQSFLSLLFFLILTLL